MTYLVVGLGNPGAVYQNTRHNAGRLIVDFWRKLNRWPEFKADTKASVLSSRGRLQDKTVLLVLPETMMNNSGRSVKPLVGVAKSKTLPRLIVVHDDLDLPLGRLRISFGRGAAGHRGVSSVIGQLKTEAFVRLRIGVCPTALSGIERKPKTQKQVVVFLLAPWSAQELRVFKKVEKIAGKILEEIILRGYQRAMNFYN